MNQFYPRNGQFWLNDQPMLIQAGEFHYFRTPPAQWPHRLGLLKAAGFNAVASYIPWLWHQVEAGRSDFDGHSHPQRNLAGFLDLAAEMGLFIIARPGPYIMAETINEGIPPWVFTRYPQVTFINQTGQAQNLASYLHPDFLACVKHWYRAIFEILAPRQITRGGKIILIQLDNEMGMPQWVRNIFDTNPDTLARFAAYRHNMRGEDISIEQLHAGLSNPRAEKIVADYRHFYRAYLREYANCLWAEAKANGLEVPPVINIHGFMNGGKTFPIGLSQLIEVMEIEGMVSATDVYPILIGEGNFHQLLLVNEMTRALHNQAQPLFSIEFQAGGNPDFGAGQSSFFDLHTRLCLSTGMRAFNHYLFFDGENDPVLSPVKRHDWGHPVRKDGTLRKHYARYPQLSKVLNAYGDALTLSQPQTVATIGFLLDHFMTEVNNVATQEATNIIAHQRETILFDFIGRGLALTHRPFNTLELTRATLDVAQTPVCWVMLEKQCPAKVQQQFVEYVRQGGKLILVGRMCVEDFGHEGCAILKEALGIQQIQGGVPFESQPIRAFDYQDVPASFVETYVGDFDEAFATQENGEAVGFIKTLGKGKVMMLGAALSANTFDDLDILHQLALKLACPSLFKLSQWADVRLSRGARGNFLFLNNYQDDPVETIIECEGQTLFGGHPIHLPARRGLILPLDWQVRPGVLIHFVTSEIIEVTEDNSALTLKTAQNEFVAEATIGTKRIKVQGKEGQMKLSNSP